MQAITGRGNRRWTRSSADSKALLRLRSQHVPYLKIGKALGVSHVRIIQVLHDFRKRGLLLGDPQKPFTTVAALSEELGISIPMLRHLMRKAGLKMIWLGAETPLNKSSTNRIRVYWKLNGNA